MVCLTLCSVTCSLKREISLVCFTLFWHLKMNLRNQETDLWHHRVVVDQCAVLLCCWAIVGHFRQLLVFLQQEELVPETHYFFDFEPRFGSFLCAVAQSKLYLLWPMNFTKNWYDSEHSNSLEHKFCIQNNLFWEWMNGKINQLSSIEAANTCLHHFQYCQLWYFDKMWKQLVSEICNFVLV